MKGETHAPLVGIPRVEPSGEGGRLVSLFDKDDGRVRVTSSRVSSQVIPRAVQRLFGLILIGGVTDPQEKLRFRDRKQEKETNYSKSLLRKLPKTEL